MTDVDLLLKAIRDAPAEDTPRLAWSDAIEETDPARAELIRVQVELGRWCPDTVATVRAHVRKHGPGESLVGREQQLILENRDRWRRGTTPDPFDGGLTGCVRMGHWISGRTHLEPAGQDADGHAVVREVGISFDRGTRRVHCAAATVSTWLEWSNGSAGWAVLPVDTGPSNWIRQVLYHHPDVTDVYMEPIVPYSRGRAPGTATVWWIGPGDPRCNVWAPLFPHLVEPTTVFDDPDERVIEYPNYDTALTHLGRACARWVRSYPYTPQ